eukprot:COSAG06_NODE_2512_length_6739_cov_4.703163_1_plen_335_part_10
MYLQSCLEDTGQCEPECEALATQFPSGVVGYDVDTSATTVSGLRRSCADGYVGYPAVVCDGAEFSPLTGCCNDFSSEPSVQVCTSCTSTGVADCTAATCAGGFGTFMEAGFCCDDFSSEPSMEVCTSCTGTAVTDCTTATCASGYVSGSFSSGQCSPCNDFSSEPSVQVCTSCTSTGVADCTAATCAGGFETFMEAGFCCDDFSSEPSVEVCTSCTGTGVADCTAATCATGYVLGSFSSGQCSPCNDFSSEPSVEVCTSCTGTAVADCTAARCATGYVPGSFSTETLGCIPSSCDVSGVVAPANGQLGSVCDGVATTIEDGESCDLTCDSSLTLT